MLSGTPENGLETSESKLFSFRKAWEHLELLMTTGEIHLSVCEDWMWLPDDVTFCQCVQVNKVGIN